MSVKSLCVVVLLSLAAVLDAPAQDAAPSHSVILQHADRPSTAFAPSSWAEQPGQSRIASTWFSSAQRKRGQAEVLMIVGGAAIVTGLLVDESLITIAGVGIGGYGLYLHLRK